MHVNDTCLVIRWQSEVKLSAMITISNISVISIVIATIIIMTTMHRDVTFAGCHRGPVAASLMHMDKP